VQSCSMLSCNPNSVHITVRAAFQWTEQSGLIHWCCLPSSVTCCLTCVAPVGANSLFSHCIQKAGFAFTSPGYSFYHWEAKAFDPGPEGSLLLLKALQNARMGSADDISLVCMPMPLFVHLCITAHCKATQTSPIIMLCLDIDQG